MDGDNANTRLKVLDHQIRQLQEELYDKNNLNVKLGEKLRAKTKMINLSVDVTNQFSRISHTNKVITKNQTGGAQAPQTDEYQE